MIALNGLPLSWGSFTQGINARPRMPKFDKLKMVYLQEESRLISRGSNFKEDFQILYSQSRKKDQFKRKTQDKGDRNFRNKRKRDY